VPAAICPVEILVETYYVQIILFGHRILIRIIVVQTELVRRLGHAGKLFGFQSHERYSADNEEILDCSRVYIVKCPFEQDHSERLESELGKVQLASRNSPQKLFNLVCLLLIQQVLKDNVGVQQVHYSGQSLKMEC